MDFKVVTELIIGTVGGKLALFIASTLIIFWFIKKYVNIENPSSEIENKWWVKFRNSLFLPIILSLMVGVVIYYWDPEIDGNTAVIGPEQEHEAQAQAATNIDTIVQNPEDINDQEEDLDQLNKETLYLYKIKVLTLTEWISDKENPGQLKDNKPHIENEKNRLVDYMNDNNKISTFVRKDVFGENNDGIKQYAVYINSPNDVGNLETIIDKMQSEQEFYYKAADDLDWAGNNEDAIYQGICTDFFDPETNNRITIQLKDIPKLKLFLDQNEKYSFDELATLLEEN